MPVGKLKRLTNITKLENRIASTTDLVKKTNYNTKIKAIEKDIPSATGFVKKKKTDYGLIENKILDITGLITTPEVNRQ